MVMMAAEEVVEVVTQDILAAGMEYALRPVPMSVFL